MSKAQKLSWTGYATIKEVLGTLQEVNFSAGEVLGSDGTEGEYIYLIAHGQVDVLRSASSSAASELADADDDIADDSHCQYLLTCNHSVSVTLVMM